MCNKCVVRDLDAAIDADGADTEKHARRVNVKNWLDGDTQMSVSMNTPPFIAGALWMMSHCVNFIAASSVARMTADDIGIGLLEFNNDMCKTLDLAQLDADMSAIVRTAALIGAIRGAKDIINSQVTKAAAQVPGDQA